MSASKITFDYQQSSEPVERRDAQNPFLRHAARSANLTTPPQEVADLFLERLKRRFILPRDSQATQANAPTEAIIITNTTGQIILINDVALNRLNHASGNLSGKTCEALLIEGLDCPHTAITGEHPVVERDILSRTGDCLLHICVNSFTDVEGNICGFAHMIRDVTSERAIERFLAEAERTAHAGLMVASVAHEVATPLSVIANMAELLLLDCEREPAIAAKLKKIVTQAHRISEMTRRMLDFFRHRPTEFADVDLADLTRETLDLIKPELRKARIQVSVENQLETPSVWGDRAQLQQVLLNLFVNAIQAMKDGGLLTVRIHEEMSRAERQRTVLLTIEDTGPGIAPQTLERMFDFFFTTKIADGGTGLGLAICKQIIEGHGGAIRAENVENGGARFVIEMHTAIAKAAGASPQAGLT